MEFLIGLGVVMVGASVIIRISWLLWFAVCWHVFGWRPKILDTNIVDQTVAECAASALANDAKDAEEVYGHTMSEEEKDHHLKCITEAFRKVIERYIQNFSLKG